MSLARLFRSTGIHRRAPAPASAQKRALSADPTSFALSLARFSSITSSAASLSTSSTTSTASCFSSSSSSPSSCRLFHTSRAACAGGHGHGHAHAHGHGHGHAPAHHDAGHSAPAPVQDYNKPLTLEELKKISLLDRHGNIIASPPPVIPEIAEIPSYTSDPSEWRSDFLPRDEVETRVLEVIRNYEIVDPAKVTLTSNFAELGFDSFDSVELVIGFEEEFAIEINDEVATNILTVKDAVDYIITHPYAK